ncbi:hypothetical protein BKA65DRAFT_542409 [Rhexocercosporidium sp. MPI-PUGE-AT-0058]|nr:hypothetical protein BKA65DRAFT_542409 [Rhexocercosporidium sp. MPI-PUGE-AT-0058]
MMTYLLEVCIVIFLWVNHLIFQYRPFKKVLRRYSTTLGTPISREKMLAARINTFIIAMFFSLVALALITTPAVVLKKRSPICICLQVSTAVFGVTQALISSGKFRDDTEGVYLKAGLKIEKGGT